MNASQAQFIETQSNSVLLASMLHAYARAVSSVKIIFIDAVTTKLADQGATLRRVSSSIADCERFDARDGSTEWKLALGNDEIGRGGVAFHYNAPYGDVYMEVDEPYRRRGYGAFFVQELKRICRELGGVPTARCSPDNIASRQTCQKAGLVPVGHLLVGAIER
ncbi:MAG: GNAT family protein [Opitutus sp.]